MKNQEIRTAVAQLQELYAQADTIKALIVERESAIKDEMDAREIETLDLGGCVIRWTSQTADRLMTVQVREYLKSMNVLDNSVDKLF